MEKIIKLVMKQDGNIDIFMNDELKHTILSTDREIYADKIFEILDCKRNDCFSVQVENSTQKDVKILECFEHLLTDIITQANKILQSKEAPSLEEAPGS